MSKEEKSDGEIRINIGKYKKALKNSINALSKNYWIVSTIILAALLIIVLFNSGISGLPTGSTISAEEAGQKVVAFISNQGGSAELVSATESGELYEIVVSIDGQEVPVYTTKDGGSLIPPNGLIPLTSEVSNTANRNTGTTTTQTQPNVPKSDKPVVELFVMSHCPYGTQMEKGILPVAEILGDKIDFEVKFVYYAMHPSAGEVEEELNQYCIQKEQNDKYLDYLTCFLGKTGTSNDRESCIAEVGIDKTMLTSCTEKTDTEFNVIANLNDQSSWLNGRFPKVDLNKEDNDKYGVGGSPTLVINGKTVQSGRDSVSLLNTICGAFNTAPEECNTQFEAGQPSPGFGYGTTTAGNNALAGCGV